MFELSEEQRQHLIQLLQEGNDIPLDYKQLLFPPQRVEAELAYRGKAREEDILADTMAVPLQPIRAFGGSMLGTAAVASAATEHNISTPPLHMVVDTRKNHKILM